MPGPINSVLMNTYLNKLKQASFENNVPYMYVDSTKNITVGVGHNLTRAQDQTSLPFKVKRFERHAVKGGDTGQPISTNQVLNRMAQPDEIQNDYDFLNKHKALGQYTVDSGKLQKYTTVELDQDDIDSLFQDDLNDAIKVLTTVFTAAKFAGFPLACQAALIDLQFNTGNIKGFPTLIRAVKGEGEFKGKSMRDRWMAAGLQSNRPQLRGERNAQVLQWFNQGANEAK